MTEDFVELPIAFRRLVVATFGFEISKNKTNGLIGRGAGSIICISPYLQLLPTNHLFDLLSQNGLLQNGFLASHQTSLGIIPISQRSRSPTCISSINSLRSLSRRRHLMTCAILRLQHFHIAAAIAPKSLDHPACGAQASTDRTARSLVSGDRGASPARDRSAVR